MRDWKYIRTWTVVYLLLCNLGCLSVGTDGDPRLIKFAHLKHKQTEELAAKFHLDVPPDVRVFFQAAERGDWKAVSNSYERMQRFTGQTNTSLCLPATNILSVPIHETLGAYDEYNLWDRALMQKYANGILQSIPAGSIYFGGTDAGRFVITEFRDVEKSPDIFIITPKFILPRDGQVISGYLDYLRVLYGEQLSLPAETDMQAAIQQCLRDIQLGRIAGRVTMEHGVAQVRGADALMNINGIVTRWIFDHNKDKHNFYFEESYVTPWMYPYLEPHGLIMKLNPEPFSQLDPAVVARDRQFWDALTNQLLADPSFLGNKTARQVYAKLRSGIGGLYQFRHLTNEAEAAFKQAVELSPESPEGVFRLSDLYIHDGRFDDAEAVAGQYHSRLSPGPNKEKTLEFIAQIRKMKRQAAERQPKQ